MLRSLRLFAIGLALASPLAAQNEAAPDSTATEASRAARVVGGMLAGSMIGVVVGVSICGEALTTDVLWTEEGPCDEGSRLSTGRIALIGAAAGALLGIVTSDNDTEEVELRVGPDRVHARRFAVEVRVPASP